jgi:hypothetical protein
MSHARIGTFLALATVIAATPALAQFKGHGGGGAVAAPHVSAPAARAAPAPHFSAPAAHVPIPHVSAPAPHFSAPAARIAAPRAAPHVVTPPASHAAPQRLARPSPAPQGNGAATRRVEPRGVTTSHQQIGGGDRGRAAETIGRGAHEVVRPNDAGRSNVQPLHGPANATVGHAAPLQGQSRPGAQFANRGGQHVLRNPAFAGRNDARDPAARLIAQSTFHGRFFDPRRRHHFHPIVIGWLGPLFWPYAYDDFVDYTFYPHAYDGFWPYAYDDVYEGIFGRYAYDTGSAFASIEQPRYRGRGGGDTTAADLCSGQTAGLTDWPIEQIAQAVEPDDAQRAALDEFKAATAKALDQLKASCPTELPSTPTGRLAALHQRLDTMLQAVRTVRPALERFYGSLNDEQKARFNALGPEDVADQRSPRDLAQSCGTLKAGVGIPLARIEQVVQPDDNQRGALKELEDATAQAASLLQTDCPTYRALTPVVRLEAMEQRLDAMLRAVTTVEPALAKFYDSLSDEQKERFNRLPPRQA